MKAKKLARYILSTLIEWVVVRNGQLDRDELFGLCLALHKKLGVRLPDDVAVGLQLASPGCRPANDWLSIMRLAAEEIR